MLEYVFFHHQPCAQFTAFAQGLGLNPAVIEGDETLEVHLPEDLPEDQLDALEEQYELMLELNQQLYDADHAGEGELHNAGVVLNLQDGRTVYAQVDPRLLGRIMSVLTPQEFGDVVNAIIDAVENPDDRPLCKRETATS